MLSSYPIPSTARLVIFGDSTASARDVAPGGATQSWAEILCRIPYTLTPAQTTRRIPRIWNFAVNGATSASILAAAAANIAIAQPTHFFGSWGVNDPGAVINRAASLANSTAIFALLPANCQILQGSVLCDGELFPNAANPNDVAISNQNTDMFALLQTAPYKDRAMWRDWRATIYGQEAALQGIAAPGVSPGPLCEPDQGAGCKHVNTGTGRRLITLDLKQVITFPG